jgi:drug/metabolite transporter (DMT)-like permease
MTEMKAHLYVLMATFLVAGSFLASANLAHALNPFSLTLLRFVGSVILLAPFVLYKKEHIFLLVKSLPKALIMSFFYAFYFVAMFEALKTTTVLNTGTIYTLIPLLTAALAFMILKEKSSLRKIFVYVVGLIGTLWVVFKGNVELLMHFSLNQGDYVYLLAVLSMCLYSIFIKLLYKQEHPWVFVLATLIGGMFWMALFVVILQEPLHWHKIEGNLMMNMLYLIVGTTIVTVYLYQKTTVFLGPTKVMSYSYLNPIAVVCLLFIIESQSVEKIVIPGIVLSCVATFLLQLQGKSKRKKSRLKKG